jgi:tRNA (cytidine/uridine-2'-O-)-methyltransferase
MLHVILYEPEIPPNTGNVIRLCANTGARLHLVHPLGFDLSERRMRRAGLDYHEYADVTEHQSLPECLAAMAPANIYAFSTRGQRAYTDPAYTDGDALIFGPETRGLPQSLLDSLDPSQVLRLPMRPNNRSLNLANTVAVAVYEAWRQQGFNGAA